MFILVSIYLCCTSLVVVHPGYLQVFSGLRLVTLHKLGTEEYAPTSLWVDISFHVRLELYMVNSHLHDVYSKWYCCSIKDKGAFEYIYYLHLTGMACFVLPLCGIAVKPFLLPVKDPSYFMQIHDENGSMSFYWLAWLMLDIAAWASAKRIYLGSGMLCSHQMFANELHLHLVFL